MGERKMNSQNLFFSFLPYSFPLFSFHDQMAYFFSMNRRKKEGREKNMGERKINSQNLFFSFPPYPFPPFSFPNHMTDLRVIQWIITRPWSTSLRFGEENESAEEGGGGKRIWGKENEFPESLLPFLPYSFPPFSFHNQSAHGDSKVVAMRRIDRRPCLLICKTFACFFCFFRLN